jgi:hypothetical protein
MSNVTNVILSIETLNMASEEALKLINKFFGNYGFGKITDGRDYIGLVGGTKNIESEIALGAFNYLDLDGLVQHIKRINWKGPTSIQLLLKGQEESLFTSHVVIDQGWDENE